MKRIVLFCAFLCSVAVLGGLFSRPAFSQGSTPEKLDFAALKTIVTGLGYESNVLEATEGKEKNEFKVQTEAFNIPMGYEISPSKNFIWLTASLGDNGAKTKHEELLKSNGAIQPTFFYITSKGRLMIAVAVENRFVTPAILKRHISKLADDVASTAKVWQTE